MSDFDDIYLDSELSNKVNLWDKENSTEDKFTEILEKNLQYYNNFTSLLSENYSENNYYNSFAENINSLQSNLYETVQNKAISSAFESQEFTNLSNNYSDTFSEYNLNNLVKQDNNFTDLEAGEVIKNTENYEKFVKETNNYSDLNSNGVNIDLSNMVNNYNTKTDVNSLLTTITEKLRTALKTSSEGVHS